ncbi:MAG: hypothetical protein V9E82_10640 [Candidatus Nanopelagicales bacterium]
MSAEFAIRVEAGIDGDMLDFPWDTHLEDWPEALFIPLPRGISRHVVRFVQVGESIMAVKETNDEVAEREFRLLRDLEELEVPSVHGIGVVTGRRTPGRRSAARGADHRTPHLVDALPQHLRPPHAARHR